MAETIYYGIWQPGLGWVKAHKKGGEISAYATEHKGIAADVAKRTGGQVRYVDDALYAMEQNLLSAEAIKQNRTGFIAKLFGRK